jgi:alcohol dehydrogenase (quinone), cytochrome c subunit
VTAWPATTAKSGKPFAGGLPMETPIGTIYSTNITPDKKTGIGDYSFEDFDNAVRHGVAKTAVPCTRRCPTRLTPRVKEA